MATGPIKDMTGLADLELTGDECCGIIKEHVTLHNGSHPIAHLS